jgi:hypothetical protein
MKRHLARGTALFAGAALFVSSQAGPLRLELGNSKSSQSVSSAIDSKLRLFGRNAAALTARARRARGDLGQFSLPTTLLLTQNGVPLPIRQTAKVYGPKAGELLTLQFEASGTRSFPAAYRTHLEDTFASAKSAIAAYFGLPKLSGTVKVLNYDSDIQDRLAVAGGAYVPNGAGGPEIRFPVYNSAIAASINFIHTLLLAYRVDASIPYDAWDEGMVRAAVIAIARTPGAIPGSPTNELIDATLESLYDMGSVYDWNNQPGLGVKEFIAPNLLNVTLPVGDSTGGPYLLRYQMAGTALYKALVEHPGFLSEFNRRLYAAPAAFQTEADLASAAQASLNAVTGSGSATVEGLSFSQWADRQFVLDGSSWAGVRSVIQAFPISPDAGSSDFGVFGVIIHSTRLLPSGDEILLSGRSYPVYWRPDGQRFFLTLQDDIVDLAGGYGSVAPNFPSSTFDSQIYRVMVDLPFLADTSRVSLPAGAYATGANTTIRPCHGTLVGFPAPAAGQAYAVKLTYGSATQTANVVNMAFGMPFSDSNFDRAQSVTLEVSRVQGSVVTPVLTRKISKSRGELGVELRASSSWISQSVNLPARLGFVGLAGQPLRPAAESVLGSSVGQTLLALWDSRQGKFLLHPDLGALNQASGLFVRPNAAITRSHPALLDFNEPQVVSLQPGWNSVAAPSRENVADSSLMAAAGAESPSTYAEAQGTILGTTLFKFTPDPVNPDMGTFVPSTSFTTGQALWVRCLRTEGGVLIFPSPLAAASSSRQASAGSMARVQAPLWELGLDFIGEKGRKSWVQIGAASNATANMDPALDSELPPSPGGFQAMTLNKTPFFRDIRGAGGSTWNLRLTGLTAGRYYEVGVRRIVGAPYGRITLVGRSQTFTLKPQFRNYFLATGASQGFTVTAW